MFLFILYEYAVFLLKLKGKGIGVASVVTGVN